MKIYVPEGEYLSTFIALVVLFTLLFYIILCKILDKRFFWQRKLSSKAETDSKEENENEIDDDVENEIDDDVENGIDDDVENENNEEKVNNKQKDKQRNEDIHDKHKVIECILVIFSWLFMLTSSYLIVAKWHRLAEMVNSDKPDAMSPWFNEIIEHFDVTGIFVGVVGILVGILIYFIVDASDERHNTKLTKNITNLSDSVTKISDVTNELRSYVDSLTKISSVTKRLKEIGAVILHATKQKNRLYILGYSLNYGQALLSNVNTILEEGKQNDFIETYNKLKNLRDKNGVLLQTYAESLQNELHIAVLRSPASDDNTDQDKFRHFLEERIFKDKEFFLIKPYDRDKDISQRLSKIKELKKEGGTFILKLTEPSNRKIETQAQIKNELINTILANCEHLKKTIDSSKITALDYVPFQFYLSVPKKDARDPQYRGVIVFTDYYNVGQQNAIISFSTRQRDLIYTLRNMHNQLIETQKKLNERLEPVKHIFKLHNNSKKFQFILKSEIQRTNETVQKSVSETMNDTVSKPFDVVAKSDTNAKDTLEHFFDNYNIPYENDVKYFRENSSLHEIFNEPAAFISVGLFNNTVSSHIVEIFDQVGETNLNIGAKLKNDCLFKFDIRRDNKGIINRSLLIADTGSNGEITYSKNFTESYFIGSPKETFDYAIVSRQLVKSSVVYIVGGIDYFGTENIIECFKCKEFIEAVAQINIKDEFVAVFKIEAVQKGSHIEKVNTHFLYFVANTAKDLFVLSKSENKY